MAKGKYGPITDDLDLIVGAEEPAVGIEAGMLAPEPNIDEVKEEEATLLTPPEFVKPDFNKNEEGLSLIHI